MERKSYIHTPTQDPYPFVTMNYKLREFSTTQPDKPAIIVHQPNHGREQITYGEMYTKATCLAKHLVKLGVKKGDLVAVLVMNGIEWAISEFGAILAGAMAMNHYTFVTDDSFDPILGMGCKCLIIDMRSEEAQPILMKKVAELHKTAQERGASMPIIAVNSKNYVPQPENFTHDFQELLRANPGDIQLPPDGDPESAAASFQTSGSTGYPKNVVLSHVSLIRQGYVLSNNLRLDNSDIYFSDRPLGYMAGFPLFLVSSGQTYVTIDTRVGAKDRNIDALCELWQSEHVTSGLVAPYLAFDIEKRRLAGKPIPKLKSIITTGQRIARKVIEDFQGFAERINTGFGSTEATWVTFLHTELDKFENDAIGYVIPGTEVKLVDEDGDIVPFGEAGEICARSISTALAYIYSDGHQHIPADKLGWLATGDMAYMTDDGKMFVKGRKSEIIKRNTAKIFPAQVERVLSLHPAVLEAVVVGVPDERAYQEICAFVTVTAGHTLTVDELRKFAHDQFQPHLFPDGVGCMPQYFFIVESFPKTASQKTFRRGVEEIALKMVSGQTK